MLSVGLWTSTADFAKITIMKLLWLWWRFGLLGLTLHSTCLLECLPCVPCCLYSSCRCWLSCLLHVQCCSSSWNCRHFICSVCSLCRVCCGIISGSSSCSSRGSRVSSS